MKKLLSLLLGAALFATLPLRAETTQPTEPTILAVRGRIVRIRVPAGFDRVTLQQYVVPRTPSRSRGVDRWRTISTKYPRGAETVMNVRISTLMPKRYLRVFGNKAEPLPGSLLTGITSFLPDPAETATSVPGGLSLNKDTVNANGTTNLSTSPSSDSSSRKVAESDIWKVQGDRMYFFNELRGLQVFDLSNPATPALLGTLRLPGAGEEMYLLGGTHAVLLKRSATTFWPVYYGSPVIGIIPVGILMGDMALSAASSNRISVSPQSDGSETGEIIVADVRAGAPVEVARVPYDGTLAESRLVGSVLYLATNVNRPATDTKASEYGVQLTSFDLADPAAPVKRDSIFLGGWANAVTATDHFFLVAKYSDTLGAWVSNSIDLVDISSPNGAMKRAGQATVKGKVSDKFQMNIDGDVLTAVTENWGSLDGGDPDDLAFRWTSFTAVQTFSIANPDAPVALGSLRLAPGETVRATRFDNGRAYVVTFRQIDPLFVVDLKDPANPSVSGHVEAPGFSTYIEPLGDRLVTIGLVDWRPAISLFDVSNPAAPRLLSQVPLGVVNGWAHSEAVWNEKAFKVIPEENLILVPVSGSGEEGGWFSTVQILDLLRDKVVKRGAIQHEFSPRRAALVNNSVVAISPSRLVTVDASNRDRPVVKADLEIAWSVNRVFNVGRYLVQIGGSADWNEQRAPRLSVSTSAQPDDTLRSIDLANMPVIGATVKDSVLYIAQGDARYYFDDADPTGATQPFTVSAYDVGSLPALPLLGSASTRTKLEYGDVTPLWPSPGILVWAGAGGGSNWRGPFWFYSRTTRLIAFDFTRPQAPKFLSDIKAGNAQPWDMSDPFASNGVVFFSYKYYGNLTPIRGDDNLVGDKVVANPSPRTSRHFLLRVDYADPAVPVVDDTEINIPGQLVGVARAGTMLLTIGQNYDLTAGTPKAGESALQVSAFDGAAAHLLDTLPLASRNQPVSIVGDTVFTLDAQVGRLWSGWTFPTDGLLAPAIIDFRGYWGGGTWVENPKKSVLSAWRLDTAGKFSKLGEIEAANDTALFSFGSLIVTQGDDRTLHLFDASDATKLENFGSFQFNGWVWPDMSHADGALDTGLWTPLGAYGIETVAAPSAAR